MKERERLVVGGLVVLMLILWLGFLVHRSPRFAGSLWGGVLAVSGSALMLVPLAYLVVKRIRPLKQRVTRVVPMRTLLAWHIYAGVLGPILVLLHTGHKFESTLGITLTAMTILVVLSGFAGRYLMNQFSQTIREKRETLTHLESAYREAAGELAAHPEQVAVLRPFSGFFSRLVGSRFLTAGRAGQAGLPLATRTLRLTESMADVEYAIQTHEWFKARFRRWLKFHIAISVALYVLLGLHVWAGIYFRVEVVSMRDRSLVPWLVAGLVILVTILAWSHWRPEASLTRAATWQAMTSPGELSRAHAFLEGNCAACHTPVRGVEAANCIVCHADDRSLLQRQPTAFHADVRECTACHIEHGGRSNRPTQMDHAQLARLGLRQLQQEAGPDPAKKAMIDRIQPWLQSAPTADPQQEILPQEAILNCSTCHANQDPHRQFFGTDCSQCHGTTAWTIPQFRHPPPSSTECAQCHQAPPSHYMEHFNMISVRVAGKPHAQVRECFQCHQTTSWNDIKGVGWYKHH